jgi:lysophospholipase L1-like esterase
MPISVRRAVWSARWLFSAAAVGVAVHLAAAQPDLRVMCMGDSITNGTEPGGYRWPLWQRLDARGWSFDLVGRIQSNPGPIPDPDHEGRNGIQITDTYFGGGGRLGREDRPGILDDLFWAIELGFPEPIEAFDVILLHIGTNDFLQQVTINDDPGLIAEHALDRLGVVLEAVRAQRPGIRVIVATIGPLSDAWPLDPVTPSLLDELAEFNDGLPALVLAQRASGQSIDLADAHAAISDDDPLDGIDQPYLADGVHPNAAGYDRLATVWDTAVERLLVAEGELPGCLADFNGDGLADFGDVGMFVQAFASGGLAGDVDRDGIFDFGDVAAFITGFTACQ